MRKRSARLGYLDPATGTYLVQMAIAAVLAGLYALKDFWASLFRRRAEPDEEEPEGPEEDRAREAPAEPERGGEGAREA
jgi:hypothetical protein